MKTPNAACPTGILPSYRMKPIPHHQPMNLFRCLGTCFPHRPLVTLPALLASLCIEVTATPWNESNNWTQEYPGVWSTTIGDPDKEKRWTELAAEPPREEALRKHDQLQFPFQDRPIEYVQTDGRIGISIPVTADTKTYGFGLQLDGIEKSQEVLELKADHWSGGRGRTHAPCPFFFTSDGFGVFIDTARYVRMRTQISVRTDAEEKPPAIDRNPLGGFKEGDTRWNAMPRARTIEADLHAKGVHLYVIAGKSPLDIVAKYNLLNGGGALPPLWGLGVWHRVPADFNEDQTLEEVEAFARNRIPLDVIGLEPGWMTASYPCTYEWQTGRFPDPEAFARKLLKKGIRLNLWENPYIAPSANLYSELLPLSGTHLVWNGIVPDYYMHRASEILTRQHDRDHIDIGISGYKTDEVDGYDFWLWPDHAVFPSGTSAETMRQTYGTLLQKVYYDKLFKARNQRTYALVRSMGGSASAHPSVLYSDSYDHLEYITGISSASLSGHLWCPEIRSAESPLEWTRRAQTVAFSPMAQINAWASGMKPWSFDADSTDALRDAFQLRLRLLPYLYTAFANYHLEGIPPIRAMILESGGSATVESEVVEGVLDGEKNPYAMATRHAANDQFMFGPSILVAPYFGKHSESREVVLPHGNWYDFYTGKLAGNGNTITVSGDQTPLYVKEGAIIPLLEKTVDRTQDAYGASLELRIYGKEPAREITIYEDDGKSFDYLKGNYRIRKLSLTGEENARPVESITGSGPALFGSVEKVRYMTH